MNRPIKVARKLRTSTIVERFSLKNFFISLIVFISNIFIVKGLELLIPYLFINSLKVGKSFLYSHFFAKLASLEIPFSVSEKSVVIV